MAKNKTSKLESVYDDIKTGKLSKESLEGEVEALKQQIEEFDKEFAENNHKITELCAKKEKATGEKGKSYYDGEIKKVQDRQEEIRKAKKNVIEQKLPKLKMKKNNIDAYAKYGEQIEEIKKVKANLVNKVESLAKTQEVTKKEIEQYKKEQEVASKEFKKLNDILKDEEKTKNLTNNQYEDLVNKVEKAKADVEKYNSMISDKQAEQDRIVKKIEELKGKIGKCDLAWKTLFTGKGWDEIKVRAQKDKARYTKTSEEKEAKKEETEISESAEAKSQKVSEPEALENGEAQLPEMVDSEEKVEEPSSLAVVEKESRLNKLKALWKKVTDKVKGFFKSSEKSVAGTVEEQAPSEPVKELTEKQPDNEAKKEITVDEHDKFLEGLRLHADKAYKKEVTSKKETQYNEMHKAPEEKGDR